MGREPGIFRAKMGTFGAQIGRKWPIWAAPRPGMVPVRGAEFDVTLFVLLGRKNKKFEFFICEKIHASGVGT